MGVSRTRSKTDLGIPRAGLLLCIAIGVLSGCSVGGTVRVASVEAGASLEPQVTLVAFRPLGRGQIDLYMTDLTREQLDPAVPLEELSGSLVHVRMFIRPRAGKTPIDSTATNATIRHVVLSGGAIGVYGGGGFLFPRSSRTSDPFTGRMRGATLVLTDRTPNFVDPLGPSTMSLSVRAPRDDALAALIAARLDESLERFGP